MAKPIGGWFRAFLGVALAAAWALGGPASTAAPLQLVTDQWIPYENLSDAEAPGFSTEVLKRVFAAMGQEASFEEFPWARAAGLVFRGERDAIFTAFRNDERARFCHFPNEPLARDKWVFFVRAADAGRLKFSSFDDLVGHDIAVLRGASISPEFWDFVHQHRNFTETASDEAQLPHAGSRPCRLRRGEFRQWHAADRFAGARRQGGAAVVPQPEGRQYVRHFQQGTHFARLLSTRSRTRCINSSRPRRSGRYTASTFPQLLMSPPGKARTTVSREQLQVSMRAAAHIHQANRRVTFILSRRPRP